MQQKERFIEMMERARLSWATIEELVAECDNAEDFWDAQWLATAVSSAKKSLVRKYIREVKDEEGMPLWHSIVTVDTTGMECHQYKQEVIFDKEDYLQVIQYYIDRTTYTMRMAESLRDRAIKRSYVEQLALPWE